MNNPQSAAFFLSDDGSALTYKKALWAFQYLRRKLGWVKNQGYQLPRLYDLRHYAEFRTMPSKFADP